MVQASRRPIVSPPPTQTRASEQSTALHPTLIRLLAQWAGTAVPAPASSFAEPLGHWLSLTDAISLSSLLGAAGRATPTHANPAAASRAMAIAETEIDRVRAALVAQADRGLHAGPSRPRHEPARPTATRSSLAYADLGQCRQHYQAAQRLMDERIGTLRQRLRALLPPVSAPLAQLAALDAVMEQALAPREAEMLNSLPQRLEKRHEQLRRVEADAEADSATAGEPMAPTRWLDTFQQDMRALMLAELELRLQPVQGLLDALRSAAENTPTS